MKFPESIFRYKSPTYQGSDQMADLALAALYSQDMHRPLVHDRTRVAYVLGYMLLVELHSADQIRIGQDSRIYPGRPAVKVDSAHADILEYLYAMKDAEPAARWLAYLAIEQKATTSVWKRLVQDGAAKAEPTWRRRRVRYELTDCRVTGWARRYLEVHGTSSDVPDQAVVLWRAVRELGLNARTLDLKPEIAARLDDAKFPTELTPLLDALTSALARVATPL